MTKEEKREYDKLYREKNRELLCAKKRLYQIQNQKKIKEYKNHNAVKIKAARKAYYLANRERELSMNREYLKTYVRSKIIIAQHAPVPTIIKAKREAKMSNAERKAKWDAKNRELARHRARVFYINNRDDLLKKSKQWRDSNKERMKELFLAWKRKNPERFRALVKNYRDRQREFKNATQMMSLHRLIKEESQAKEQVKNGTR